MNLRNKSHKIKFFSWNNKKIYYRTSSSDMSLIYEILLKPRKKAEYFFPNELEPKVILYIGGNIGITSIFLSTLFPKAKIYTFEPIKENFDLLKSLKTTAQKVKLIVKSIKETGLTRGGTLRVHIGGDYYSQSYFNAWMKASSFFPNIVFYSYTKSLKF